MPTKQKESSGSFFVAVVFILSAVVLILIFVLFTRAQGTKAVEQTLSGLAKSNAELQQEQKIEKQKPINERLKEAGLDPNSLWQMNPCESIPYCTFEKTELADEKSAAILSIERWSGYHEKFKDEQTSCDRFVLEDGTSQPITMELLATIEQNLLKNSSAKEPTAITVYRYEDHKRDEKKGNPCEMPSFVLNVHL